MDFSLLIPIVAILAPVAIVKIYYDSRLRQRLAEAHASEDLVRAMLEADERNRSVSALKWSIVLTLIGLSFGLIDAAGLGPNDPATFGLLIGSAGVGMLGFHLIAARKR